MQRISIIFKTQDDLDLQKEDIEILYPYTLPSTSTSSTSNQKSLVSLTEGRRGNLIQKFS